MDGPPPADRVAALAAEIRALKAELKKGGLKSDAINQHSDVVSKVAALKELKDQLDKDDPARDEAFFARQQAEKEEAARQEQALMKRQRGELQAVEAKVSRPLVQRKIFHLFHFAGSGPNFHYEPPPRLNAAQSGFGEGVDPHPAVYVTEKWDGTTMQATRSCIFKRLDLRAGGKKSKLEPSERYDLRLIAWRSEDTDGEWRGLDFLDADKRVAEAVERYLPQLAALPEDLCVYFEVVHTDINATFKNIPGFADIRVFDFSRAAGPGDSEGGFLAFEETITLASTLKFPLVAWRRHDRLDARLVWSELRAAKGSHYENVPAPLEGFVVREAGTGGRIAKARVEHLLAADIPDSLDAAPPQEYTPVASSPKASRAYGCLDAAHLADLGLWPGGPAYTLRRPGEAPP